MKDSFAAKFFLSTFVITGVAWGLLILRGNALDPSSPSYLLFMLGGFGPSLAGLIPTAVSDGRTSLRDLWRRIWRLRFGYQWYLVIFLLFPTINTVGTILPTDQSDTIGLAIISVVILIPMLRRLAHEIGTPEQPPRHRPAFDEK